MKREAEAEAEAEAERRLTGFGMELQRKKNAKEVHIEVDWQRFDQI